MVILDTNIFIDHLRQGDKSRRLELLLKKFGVTNLSVSMVTVQELYAGASSKFQGEQILVLTSNIKIWPYIKEIAKLAGEIERDLGREIEFVDAAIAATCIVNKCQLATLNQKDFVGIKGLKVVELNW